MTGARLAISASILALAAHAPAQPATDEPPPAPETAPPSDGTTAAPPEPAPDAAPKWEFSLSALVYIVPDGRDFVQPVFTADHDHLHLEARYNYEAMDTGSAWIGVNLSSGEEVVFALTPMVGAVFGDLNGIAPGYELSLSWWKLELYSEGEFFIDPADQTNDFFYTWTQFTIQPTDWLQTGIVIQRTKAYESDMDIQPGLMLVLTYEQLEFSGYVFNLGWEDPTFAIGIGFSF